MKNARQPSLLVKWFDNGVILKAVGVAKKDVDHVGDWMDFFIVNLYM